MGRSLPMLVLLLGACTRLGFGDRPVALADAGNGTDARTLADGARDLPVDPDGHATDGTGFDGAPDDAGPGLSGFRGQTLFEEHFDDGDFAKRGWYDGQAGTLITTDPAPGSSSALECLFDDAAGQYCKGGAPGRHLFTPTEAVYVAYWVKYGPGTGTPIEFFLHTDVDEDYVGPASSHLSLLLSPADDGRYYFRLEDNENVDNSCVKLTDGTVVGCDRGGFDLYSFGETRSVCSCNGLVGDLDEHDCFEGSPGRHLSRRYWYSSRTVLTAADRGRWYFVEAYARMNSIVNGIGVPDGRLYLAVDDEVLIGYERILFRTGQHPTMRWKHLMLSPVYGKDGEKVWFDELVVAQGR
jgi:hypothetical protein